MSEPQIPGYTIEKILGRGGFASVYLAQRDITNERVAIKVLYEHNTDTDELKRFERERMSLHALAGHPHIVDIEDFGVTGDGHHYLILEYVEGGSIQDRLRASGAMHWWEATRIGVQICSALDAAHRSGVLHRDIKPANILDGPDGAKLGDFGIARLVGQTQLTAAQSIIGTLAYTPPEVLHNRAFDGRGDIYQLGITLYEILLGRAPFKSGSSDNKAMVIRRILENPAPPLAQFDIPQPISDLLDTVLAKDPADRPQTAATFAAALNNAELLLGQAPTEARVATRANPRTALTSTAAAPTAIPDWPAQAPPLEPQPTPAAPVIDEPPSDRTIVEPRPSSTSVYTPVPSTPAAPPVAEPARSSPISPVVNSPSPRRSGVVVGVLAVLLLIGGVGVAIWQLTRADSPGSDAGGSSTTTDPAVSDTVLPIVKTIERVGETAFAAAGRPEGLIFGAVANSQGLTAVGATGTGDFAGAQTSAIWTMAANGTWNYREKFPEFEGANADGQRLWSIGVMPERFLAVGERTGGDGVAWIGALVDGMTPLADDSFIGPGNQGLFAATGDAGRDQFLVAGVRSGQPALWIVAGEPSWEEPTWTVIPIGDGAIGRMTDVAVAGDTAVAVGYHEGNVNNAGPGLVLIRNGELWQNLLAPIPNTSFNAVDFFGDRIVAVGTRTVDGVSRPLAVVTDTSGIGLIHELPMAGDVSGKANDVVATEAGVFAVGLTGEVDGDAAFEDQLTDGALWQLVPGDEPGDDRWKTRDTDELGGEPGFQEFWSVVEFEGNVFALGRADADDSGNEQTVAAAWQVTVDEQPNVVEPASDEVIEAQSDAAPSALPEGVEGDTETGVAEDGCAAQAVADVQTMTNDDSITLDPVLITATEGFALWICEDDTGQLWYHGAQRDPGTLYITRRAEVSASGDGYVAIDGTDNNITEYRIEDGRLTVRAPNGDLTLDQVLVDS